MPFRRYSLFKSFGYVLHEHTSYIAQKHNSFYEQVYQNLFVTKTAYKSLNKNMFVNNSLLIPHFAHVSLQVYETLRQCSFDVKFLQAIDLCVMRTITKKIVYTDFVVFRFLAAFFLSRF